MVWLDESAPHKLKPGTKASALAPGKNLLRLGHAFVLKETGELLVRSKKLHFKICERMVGCFVSSNWNEIMACPLTIKIKTRKMSRTTVFERRWPAHLSSW